MRRRVSRVEQLGDQGAVLEKPAVGLTERVGFSKLCLMKKIEVLPAPEARFPLPTQGKWEMEYRAFERLRPSLLRSHRDKFVAVHKGKVVDSGEDKVSLGLRVYAKFGYVPIYVGRVSAKPQRAVRMPSPRRPCNAASE